MSALKPSLRSGRLNLKVPRTLHTRMADVARREGVSLNQLVVYLLSQEIDFAEASWWPNGAKGPAHDGLPSEG